MKKLILTGLIITMIAGKSSAMMPPAAQDIEMNIRAEPYMFIEDENRDEIISADELERHIFLTCDMDDACRTRYENSFNNADKNDDGYITQDERNIY